MNSNFWKHVDKHGPVLKEELGPCWLWTGQHDKKLGYAKFTMRVPGAVWALSFKAHRIAYEEVIGPIPEGKELDHKCRNRGCVNPYHTEPVTHKENVLRGEAPSAKNAAKATCLNGHPLVQMPSHWKTQGRWCPVCHEARRKLYK